MSRALARATLLVALATSTGSLSWACSRSDADPDLTPPVNEAKERAKERAKIVLARLRADDEKRAVAITKALAGSGPRPDLGPCPIAVGAPPSEGEPEGGARPLPGNLPVTTDRALRIPAADVSTTPGVRLTWLTARITGEAAHPSRGIFAGPPDETIDSLGSPAAFAWELDLVIDEQVEPRVLDETTFAGGVMAGRALLYSYLREDVVCAADFVAGSSERLRRYDKDPKGARDLLLRDLETEAVREGVSGLAKIGPRLAVADAGGARVADAGGARAGGAARAPADGGRADASR